MTKQKKLRHSEYYDMQPTFDKLYADSKNGKTFTKLMDIISSEENILLAYRNIKRNGGSTTAGTDKRTIADRRSSLSIFIISPNVILHFRYRYLNECIFHNTDYLISLSDIELWTDVK